MPAKLLNLDDGKELLDYIDQAQWGKIFSFFYSFFHDREQYLVAEDPNGKTILQRLINIKEGAHKEIQLSFGTRVRTIPPFWRALEKVCLDTRPIREEVMFFLKLGIDVNRQYSHHKEGYSALHIFLIEYHFTKKPIDTITLKELIMAGGDIYLKDKKGTRPIDLVKDPRLKDFMESCYNKNKRKISDEEKAAIPLQRAIRVHAYRNANKKSCSHGFFPRRRIENIKSFFPKFTHPDLTLDIEPQTGNNAIDPEVAKLWVADHEESQRPLAQKVIDNIYYVSYEHFANSGLRVAVEQFNEYIMSLPEQQRDYTVYLFSERYKSNPWVTRHAFDFCAHIPVEYIQSNEIYTKEVEPHVRHLVIFEDHSLSGNALMRLFEKWDEIINKNLSLLNLEIHVVVPFLTQKALEGLKQCSVRVYYSQIIPAFDIVGTEYRNPATLMYTQWKVPDTRLSTAPCLGKDSVRVDGKPSSVHLVPETNPVYKEGMPKEEGESISFFKLH